MTEMKTTQGVMVNVVNDVNQFIGEVDDYKITPIYSDLFKSIKDKVEQLASLEELILQQRCMNPDGKIKLSLLREYVYARCPFYRRDKSTKDIRVLIGRIDLLDQNTQSPTLDDLYNNPDVMRTALVKLLSAMKDEFVAKSEVYFKMYD